MDRAAKISELRKRLELLENRKRAPSLRPHSPEQDLGSLEEMLGGEVRQTPHGCCLAVENSFHLSLRHGRHLLEEAFRNTAGRLLTQGGDQRLRGFVPDRALFIDTETTGLAMGTGTYAFLVGVGARRGDHFRVCQFFMRDFSEEGAQLHLLGELLKEGDFLVSYNGKSYDVPLLENRFVMSRMGTDLSAIPHLDLLYTARRLWKHRLEDCRLATVERELLGVRRADDIPAEHIPRVYFDYLRGGGRREMGRVFRHNLLDILSLTVLSGLINSAFALLAGPALFEAEDGGDFFALGRLWEEAGMEEQGRLCYEKALALDMTPEQRRRATARLSFVHKRAGRWGEAVALWERMLTEDPEDVFPYQELAKYYEHRAGDFVKALEVVEEALGAVSFSDRLYGEAADNIISGLEHRRNRLRVRSGMGGRP